jgi:hypothetical protein
LIAGIGLSLALYDQPKAGRRLGWTGWLLRIGAAAAVAALAQLAIFWLGEDYAAASFSNEVNFYYQHYRRYDFVRQWMDNTPGWERFVMVADMALGGLVLAVGMTLGITAAPRWAAWWRKTVDGNEGILRLKEGA